MNKVHSNKPQSFWIYFTRPPMNLKRKLPSFVNISEIVMMVFGSQTRLAASGFARAKISGIYSCYTSFGLTLSKFKDVLESFVLDIRGPSPKVTAGGKR